MSRRAATQMPRKKHSYEPNRPHEFTLQLTSDQSKSYHVEKVNESNSLSELLSDFKTHIQMNEAADIQRDFVIISQDGIIVGEIGDIDALRKSTIE